jgi:hypothetical protein
MTFLIFAPAPPHKGTPHLVRSDNLSVTRCGRTTGPSGPHTFASRPGETRFGWAIRAYTSQRQLRRLCKRCQKI